MKITLCDNKVLDFGKLDTYEERKVFIEANILNKQPYCNHYNLYGEHVDSMTKEQYNTLVSRWLGVKVVGKPNKNEQLKGFLDYLAGYMLNARDTSEEGTARRYFTLSIKEILNEDEVKELEVIKDKVFYSDMSIGSFATSNVFVVNSEMEVILSERLSELQNKNNRDFTEEFMLKDIEYRLNICNTARQDVENASRQIEINKTNIKKLNKLIREQESHEDFSSECVYHILSEARRVKELKEDIVHQKFIIKNCYEQYYMATESSLIRN